MRPRSIGHRPSRVTGISTEKMQERLPGRAEGRSRLANLWTRPWRSKLARYGSTLRTTSTRSERTSACRRTPVAGHAQPTAKLAGFAWPGNTPTSRKNSAHKNAQRRKVGGNFLFAHHLKHRLKPRSLKPKSWS